MERWALLLYFAILTAVPFFGTAGGLLSGESFQLDFEGFPSEITGYPGEEKQFEIYCRLTTANLPPGDGPQGWSIGVGIEGGQIERVGVAGILVNTIYDQTEDVEEPIHHDNYVMDLVKAFARDSGLATHKDDPSRKGAISTVILEDSEHMVLHPNSRDRIARLTVKVTIPEDRGQVTLRFEDGFEHIENRPIINVITYNYKSSFPQLGSCTIPILGLTSKDYFHLNFEGYPSEIIGNPGEEKQFEIYCRLTTANLPPGDGPQGWSIGVGIEGGQIEKVGVSGVLVNTIYDQTEDVEEPIHHDNYVLDLVKAFARDGGLATHKDDPSRKGAISTVILEDNEHMVLHPNSRDRIARLTVKVTIPEDRGQVTLRYEEGFERIADRPIINVITYNNKSHFPQLGSCTIPILPEPEILPVDVAASSTLTDSEPGKLFTLVAPAGTSVSIALTDPDPGDANALYLRWGDIPEDSQFDLAADAPDRADQMLVIPFFRDEPAYVLVQTSRINGGSSDVTLEATVESLVMGTISTSFQGLGGSGRLDVAISGAGFGPDTCFSLENQGNGEIEEASETVIVSSERAEVTFQLAKAPVGKYDLNVENPGGDEAVMESAFQVLETRRGPILEVRLSAPDRCRYDRLGGVTLMYSNTGDAEMTAPLFKVVGPEGSELRLQGEAEFQGNVIQVLGIDPRGVAGKLSQGAKGEIPIIFKTRAESEAEFQVYVFDPNLEDFVGWESVAPPEFMDLADWEALWPPLSVKLGASWIEYREALAERATRLARRGVDASSVRELFRFAAREALGRPSSAVAGRVRDAASGAPLDGATVLALKAGVVRSSAVSGDLGNYSLDWLEAGEAYEIRLVDLTPGNLSVTLPAQGDALGVDLLVAAETNGLEPGCPDCDESGLPRRPLLPPEGLFSQISDRSLEVIRTWDPNEKNGPAGGEVGKDDEVIYSIFFENHSTATAWAQEVEVVDQLDADFDLSTFRLVDIRLGDDRLFTLDRRDDTRGLPQVGEGIGGSRIFERMGPDGQWLLHILCDLDRGSGLVRWTFRTLDPATGMVPDSFRYPDAGFLPPNDETHRGEGQVVFSVKPKADLEDGTELTNDATIVFDLDLLRAVKTNVVTSRFRRSLPPELPRLPYPRSGTVHPVEIDIVLSWQGTAESFDLYLWPDGQEEPVDPVARRIGENSYRPAGLEPGTIYRWRVVARSQAGTSAGEVWTFKTVEPQTDPVITIDGPRPGTGALDQPRLPLLSCVATGAPAYDLYLWPHDGQRSAIARGLKAIHHRPRKMLEPELDYDWQVVAILREGVPPIEGPVWTFRTRPMYFRRGDLEGRGSIIITDAIFILNFLFLGGQESICLKSMDLNDDGFANITDVIYMLNYLYLGGEAPGEPFETCGPDPLEDSLSCGSYPPCDG